MLINIGLIIAGIVGIAVGAFVYWITGSIIFTLIGAIGIASIVFDPFLQASGDINRATQHERDGAILSAIQDLKDKD